MDHHEVWPPAPVGDEPVAAMLTRTALLLAERAEASSVTGTGLWQLRFVDTDHTVDDVEELDGASQPPAGTVHLPLAPITWRAEPVPAMSDEDEPVEALVAWRAADDAVGLVLSSTTEVPHIPQGRARLTVAVLRDQTSAIVLGVPGQPPAVVPDSDHPLPALQALRRCLGLPSGLPDPQPALLLARMHAAVLEALAALPDDRIPDRDGFTELLEADDPDAASRVEELVARWQADGLPDAAVRRGALVATVASSQSVAASLVSNPIAGALIPLVGDVDGWATVVTRLRVSPPASTAVREEFWGWADDAMIAAVISSVLPPLGRSPNLERLVATGALPADAAELSVEAVARIAAGGAHGA